MSITSIGYNTSIDALAVKADDEKTEWNASKAKSSEEWLDSVALSSMSEKLSSLIRSSSSGDIVADMTKDLQTLQGNFIEALTDKLGAQGVDLTESFILSKDEDGKIIVEGDHPDKEAIEAAINGDETLKAAYETIAEQAELLQSVSGNTKYQSLNKGLSAYQSQQQFMQSMQSMSLAFLLGDDAGSGSLNYGLASYL